MEKGIIEMSQRELSKLHVIRKVFEGSLKQIEAARKLDMSTRQVRRILIRMQSEGDRAVIHRLRGRVSQRRISQSIWEKIQRLYATVYAGFGPTFLREKLQERNGILISDETLRKRLISENTQDWQRKGRKHRQWRERKHHQGEMLQMDGSHHAWFEDRGPRCVLMSYIDDATGKKYGRFYTYEGTLPAFDSLKRYIEKNGIPKIIYLDRHSTYKVTKKIGIHEELNNKINLSQFERGANELGIHVIHANSPQAKGRIERSFKTDQDRLVKELRLAGIRTIKQANVFLESYWNTHNAKFSKAPMNQADMHSPVSPATKLERILCIKTDRAVRNDFTIVHKKKLYQIVSKGVGKWVVIEERVDDKLYIVYKGKELEYKRITKDELVKKEDKPVRKANVWRPPADHPFKRQMFERRIAMAAASRVEEQAVLVTT